MQNVSSSTTSSASDFLTTSYSYSWLLKAGSSNTFREKEQNMGVLAYTWAFHPHSFCCLP